jgi:PPOX class probable F420-dependent enzyme
VEPLRADEGRYLTTKERGFLATVNADGTPTVVPVCFAYERGTIYTAVDTKPKSERLARIENIRRAHEAAFIVDVYSRDWRRLSYLLIHGKAGLVRDGRERRRAVRLLTRTYSQYGWLGKGMKDVVKIRVERTKFWQFKKARPPGLSFQPPARD